MDRYRAPVLQHWMQEDDVKEFGVVTMEQLVLTLREMEEIALADVIAEANAVRG